VSDSHKVNGTFTGPIIRNIGVLSWLGAAAFARARFELHHHHQIIQTVPAEAAQPAHVPVAEAGAQGDRCTKAKEFGFRSHCVDPRVRTFMALSNGRVKMAYRNATDVEGWDSSVEVLAPPGDRGEASFVARDKPRHA